MSQLRKMIRHVTHPDPSLSREQQDARKHCVLHVADQRPQRDLLLGTGLFGLLNEVFVCLGNAQQNAQLDC